MDAKSEMDIYYLNLETALCVDNMYSCSNWFVPLFPAEKGGAESKDSVTCAHVPSGTTSHMFPLEATEIKLPLPLKGGGAIVFLFPWFQVTTKGFEMKIPRIQEHAYIV